MNRGDNTTVLTMRLNHFVFVSGLGRKERRKGGTEGRRKKSEGERCELGNTNIYDFSILFD